MKYLIALAVLFFAYNVTAIESEPKRDAKFLSMFNIVRFPNDACDGGSRNGTCYTKEECSNKGGTEDGDCAQGYGVCCTFISNCGASLSENNTYFESTGDEKSHCSIQVCKASSTIVQLRLDFVDFVINQPETSITTVAYVAGGVVTTFAGKTASEATRCLTDVFSVSNPGGPSPPQICGNNVDEHMYVDMGAECIDLTFQLSLTGSLDAKWNIRVTQYEKTYDNLAPFGCTQYFWKQDSDSDGKGTIQSYNWSGARHLADQNQVICIRREDDKTKICYSTTEVTDFSISGANGMWSPAKATCGGYAKQGSGTFRDALIIRSLEKSTGAALAISNICGQQGLSTAVATVAATAGKKVCSSAVPFIVTFTSDSWEQSEDESVTDGDNKGFKINYEQS